MSRWTAATAAGTVLAALALALGAPASAQTGAAALVPSGAEEFPKRAFRLSLPQERALTADQLKVYENGERVGGVELVPAGGGAAKTFGTVLVIDASLSMRGQPIAGAMAAARDLAGLRAGNQQLGLVVFNNKPSVALELTENGDAIADALARPPALAPQTHVYDAVNTGLDALKQGQIFAGTIVVLSDGADTGSVAALSAVAKRARAEGVRVFSIGLESGAFSPAGLKRLAEGASPGGRYSGATSVAGLRAIFQQIGSQLATEYLIRYRSTGRPGEDMRVAARIDGIPQLATATYKVPGDATFVLVEDSFWTSTLGAAITTIVCALLLALALGLLIIRRVRGPGVRQRIGAFVTTAAGPPDETTMRNELLSGVVLHSGRRSIERAPMWVRFAEKCEVAGLTVDPLKLVGVAAAFTALFMWLLAAATGSILPALVLAVCVPLGIRTFVNAKLAARRRAFADQLPDMLQGVASALRAGHAFVGALSMVIENAPEPSRSEFRRVISEERLGVPLEDSLDVMRHRMDSRDVQQVGLVAELQRETGGNAAEVLDRVTATVRQRAELRRMVRGLTAQGRLSRTIVSLLPVALALFISVTNPGYLEPLLETSLGRAILVIGILMLISGSLIIKKIVDFEV